MRPKAANGLRAPESRSARSIECDNPLAAQSIGARGIFFLQVVCSPIFLLVLGGGGGTPVETVGILTSRHGVYVAFSEHPVAPELAEKAVVAPGADRPRTSRRACWGRSRR